VIRWPTTLTTKLKPRPLDSLLKDPVKRKESLR